MKHFKYVFFLMVLLIGFGSIYSQSESNETIKPIYVTDDAGEKVNLKSLIDNSGYQLIVFWSVTDNNAKEMLKRMNSLAKEWMQEYSIEVLIISLNKENKTEKIKKLAKKENWEYTLLFDYDDKSKELFNISQLPYTILVDNTGRIVQKFYNYKTNDEFIIDEKLSKYFYRDTEEY